MAMLIGPSGEDDVLSQINTTPLVDVTLVLLIIFLITIPAAFSSVLLKLPKQTVEERHSAPQDLVISVDQHGTVYWNDRPLAGQAELKQLLGTAAANRPQPKVQIRGDMASRYESVGKIMFACQVAGIAKVSFITEPGAARP